MKNIIARIVAFFRRLFRRPRELSYKIKPAPGTIYMTRRTCMVCDRPLPVVRGTVSYFCREHRTEGRKKYGKDLKIVQHRLNADPEFAHQALQKQA